MFIFVCSIACFVLFLLVRVSLYISWWTIHYVHQAGLKLRDLCASGVPEFWIQIVSALSHPVGLALIIFNDTFH